jgi:hypothetical protein
MLRKLALTLAVAALFVLPAATSLAQEKQADEGFVGLGAQFTWQNYKTTLLDYSGMDANPGLASTAYGGPNFGGALHWGITNQIVLMVALDLGVATHTVFPYPDNGSKDVSSVTASYYSIGALLGLKYYFSDPAPNSVHLYLSGGIGAYFAGTSTSAKINDAEMALKNDNCGDKDDPDQCWSDWKNDQGNTDALDEAQNTDDHAQNALAKRLKMIGDLSSPIVFQIAIGAEFFASQYFSVGADVLGLRLAYAWTNVGKAQGTSAGTSDAWWSGEQSYLNFYVYSGLTMTFNLTGGGEAKKEEPPPADDGWGTPAPQPAQPGWGTPAPTQPAGGGWGTPAPAQPAGGGWGAQPAPQPAPAPAPAPAPQPQTQPGWSTQPPPPPPPPPPPGY